MNYIGPNTSEGNTVGAGLKGKEDNMRLTDPTVLAIPSPMESGVTQAKCPSDQMTLS